MSNHIYITIPVKDENTDAQGNKAPPTDRPLSAEEQSEGMAERRVRNTQIVDKSEKSASYKAPLLTKGRDELEAKQMSEEEGKTLGDLLVESLQNGKENVRLEATDIQANDPTVFASSDEVTGFESEQEMREWHDRIDPATGQRMIDHEPAYRSLVEARMMKTELGADGRLNVS